MTDSGELRKHRLYAGRSLDFELAITVPASWSPPGDDWVGKALRSRAWDSLRWLAVTLEHVVDNGIAVCNDWPDVDEAWFRNVQAAASELDDCGLPVHLLTGTKNLIRHMILQNAGVYRREAIEPSTTAPPTDSAGTHLTVRTHLLEHAGAAGVHAVGDPGSPRHPVRRGNGHAPGRFLAVDAERDEYQESCHHARGNQRDRG